MACKMTNTFKKIGLAGLTALLLVGTGCGTKQNKDGNIDVNHAYVVLDRLPLVPITLMVDVPGGADSIAAKVKVVEQVGLHEVGENEGVTPLGNPVMVYETACEVPETKLAVIAFVTEPPRTKSLSPAFVKK